MSGRTGIGPAQPAWATQHAISPDSCPQDDRTPRERGHRAQGRGRRRAGGGAQDRHEMRRRERRRDVGGGHAAGDAGIVARHVDDVIVARVAVEMRFDFIRVCVMDGVVGIDQIDVGAVDYRQQRMGMGVRQPGEDRQPGLGLEAGHQLEQPARDHESTRRAAPSAIACDA